MMRLAAMSKEPFDRQTMFNAIKDALHLSTDGDIRLAMVIVRMVHENLKVEEVPQLTQYQRLLADHDELAKKVQSLKLYMMTDAFKALSRAERQNLETQSRHMHGYLSVLDARIAYYEVTR